MTTTTARCSAHQDLEIPMPLPSGANLREHWQSRHRRIASQRATTMAMLRTSAVRPELPCTVRLVRVANRMLDSDDNVPMSMKGPRDAIAEWLGIDDADPRVCWLYGQQKAARPRYHALRIIVAASQEICVHCGAATIRGRHYH